MTAIDRALADITRTFTPPMNLKRRVRVLIRSVHFERQLSDRYERKLERFPNCSIQTAIIMVRRYLQVEQDKRTVAIALWYRYGGTNTDLIHLQDAALMLRWLRRYDPFAWAGIRNTILDPEAMREAAE